MTGADRNRKMESALYARARAQPVIFVAGQAMNQNGRRTGCTFLTRAFFRRRRRRLEPGRFPPINPLAVIKRQRAPGRGGRLGIHFYKSASSVSFPFIINAEELWRGCCSKCVFRVVARNVRQYFSWRCVLYSRSSMGSVVLFSRFGGWCGTLCGGLFGYVSGSEWRVFVG